MAAWNFPVALDPRSATPLFLQISRAISDDVLRGRLRPGAALPGSRTLATTLGVHRSTVVSAYAELGAQGWLVARPGGVTAVADTSPDVKPRRFAPARPGVPAQPAFSLPAPAPPPWAQPEGWTWPLPSGTLALWSDADLRLVDTAPLGRALRRAARQRGGALLDYTPEWGGHPALRAELARMVSSTRGLAASASDVIVTQGSQMALDLVARALTAPGDVVAVEAPGYRPAWWAFHNAGARVHPVPVDAEGLDVAALEPLVGRLRAVYLTPHHQHPTTVTLSPRRRVALLALARLHRFAIIEDDYDHEFHYDVRPVLPLASADQHGSVIYVGTLAKILAPGLRIGFVVASPAVLARLSQQRYFHDRQGNFVVEQAVAELLEDGEVTRHVRRIQRLYRRRRDALVTALQRRLGDALSFAVPAGGMCIWARAAAGVDVMAWRRRAEKAGVIFKTGESFTFDAGPWPYLRLGFARLDEAELDRAVKRLARVI
jgi:GntR family transcriptional regulator/MocR family aminotransferase